MSGSYTLTAHVISGAQSWLHIRKLTKTHPQGNPLGTYTLCGTNAVKDEEGAITQDGLYYDFCRACSKAYRVLANSKCGRNKKQRKKKKKSPLVHDPAKFRCIVADPPQRFDDKLDAGRSIDNHYDTMSLEEIYDMGGWIQNELVDPVGTLLFLWLTNAFIIEGEGAKIARAWGFEPKQMVTWGKTTKDGTRPAIGLGRYFRNSAESFIVARRGKVEILDKGLPSWFTSPRLSHSEKPVISYSRIERLCPGPRLELFSRKERPGWSRWGNEAPVGDGRVEYDLAAAAFADGPAPF